MRSADECPKCSEGFWCSAGNAVPCGLSTYNDLGGADARVAREALRDGDGDRARTIMREHMEMARSLMEDQEAVVMKRFMAE